MNLQYIRAKVLFKLARRRKWGESHTPIDLALKGFKKSDISEAKNALANLIKINWVLVKPTFSGQHVSLNPSHAQEIKEEIRKLLRIDFW